MMGKQPNSINVLLYFVIINIIIIVTVTISSSISITITIIIIIGNIYFISYPTFI